MRLKQTNIDFGPGVRKWSYERFIQHFTPIYPDADLPAYAKSLGLVKEPAATDEEAPVILSDDRVIAVPEDVADALEDSGLDELLGLKRRKASSREKPKGRGRK